MRAVINALSLGRHRTGTGNFTYYVLKELLDLDGTDTYVCVVPSDVPPQAELGDESYHWESARGVSVLVHEIMRGRVWLGWTAGGVRYHLYAQQSEEKLDIHEEIWQAFHDIMDELGAPKDEE